MISKSDSDGAKMMLLSGIIEVSTIPQQMTTQEDDKAIVWLAWARNLSMIPTRYQDDRHLARTKD